MTVAVQSYLNDNQPIWSVVSICNKFKKELDGLILSIRVQLEQTGLSSKGLTEKKDALKDLIAKKTGIIAGAIAAYAAVTNQPELLGNGYLKKSDVTLLRDPELPDRLKAFVILVTSIVKELAEYGVTEEQVAELESGVDDFRELVGKPRLKIAKAQIAKKEASALVDEAVKLLDEKMDNVMLGFEETHPTFYEGYRRARVIVD